MKKKFIIISLVFIGFQCFSQKILDASSKEKPSWFDDLPKSEYNLYYVGIGESDALKTAQEEAIADVMKQLSSEVKFTIDMESETRFKKEVNVMGTQENISESFVITGVLKSTNQPVTIKGLKIEDQYWQLRQTAGRTKYEYWILMKRPKPGFENVASQNSTSYGLVPVWRSALIPGWGQLYKKEKGKGILFLTSELVLVSGSLFCHNMYAINFRKARDAFNENSQKNFTDNADQWSTARNVTIAVAGGLYLWNVIDALTSRGAKIYSYNPRKWNIVPLISNNYATLQVIKRF